MSSESSDDVDEGEYFGKEGPPTQPGLCAATHMRAEVECSGLVVPPAVVAFLERYAT